MEKIERKLSFMKETKHHQKSGKEPFQLYINVVEAHDLQVEKGNGKLICRLRSGLYSIKTNPVTAKPNCKWKQEFLFLCNEKTKTIDFEIILVDFLLQRRKNTIMGLVHKHLNIDKGGERFLGTFSIPFNYLKPNQLIDEWFKLQAPTMQGSDEIDLPMSDMSLLEIVGRSEIRLQLHLSENPAMLDVQEKLREPKYSNFIKLLTNPPFSVVSILSDVTDSAESDKIAPALVKLFFYFGNKTNDLLKFIIRKEVQLTSSTNILFRSNSMAIKLVSVYAKLVGTSYIKTTLGPLIKEVNKISNPLEYEMDPSKAPGSNFSENAQRLNTLTQRFLSNILSSFPNTPTTIREICSFFYIIVGERFPEFSDKAVGGFIFLRFFCPACVSPESFKLVDEMKPENRRILVLVAKILQNLANGVEFLQKEVYMQPMNSFITKNLTLVQKFFQNFGEVNEINVGTRPDEIVITPDDVFTDLLTIHKYLSLYLDKITSISSENRGNPIPLAELTTLINNIKQETDDEKFSTSLLPYAIYNSRLQIEGVIRIDREETSDVAWLQQQEELQSLYEDDSECVLNSTPIFNHPPRDLCEIANDLLKKLLDIYTNMDGKWNVIRNSPEYQQFCEATTELQKVDLYVCYPGLITFWINIFNCLVLHLHVVMGSPPSNEFRRRIFFNHFKYKIGRHNFSLSDIQDGILRGNPKNRFTRHRHFRSGDYRRALVLPVDRRIHFALSYLNQSSPGIRIYNAQSIDEELQVAGELFLQNHMGINVEGGEIILPRMFERYSYDLEFSSKHELLVWLFQFLPTRKRLDLLLLLETNNYHISYSEYIWETLNIRKSQLGLKNSVINLVYEVQAILKHIWGEVSIMSSLQGVFEVATTIKSIHTKLRTFKDSQPRDTFPPTLDHSSITKVLVLGPSQRANIPEDKHRTFLKLLRTIGATIEESINILNIFIVKLGSSAEMTTRAEFSALLTSIKQEAKQLQDRLPIERKEDGVNQKSLFLLMQAIASEVVDICNILKLIEQELNILDVVKNPKDIPILLTFAIIVRYAKNQLEANPETDKLLAFELKPEHLAVPKASKQEYEKLESLKTLTKKIISSYIYKSFKEMLANASKQTSPKQALHVATKVRNIRNALRSIKGKKLRSITTDSRLTVRILDTSKSEEFKRELNDEELQNLANALAI